MNTTNNFRIFNASAGSGKTYSLVRLYLKIILEQKHPGNYREILAITFTNKAVSEMKNRILDSLVLFSSNEPELDKHPLFKDLMASLKLKKPALQARAQLHLKHLLHHYAFFEISTIDKFTNRIVRTFARDLQLPQNFEVVLDVNSLMAEAVDALIANIGVNAPLTKSLLQFTLDKVNSDKSWDIKKDLAQNGMLLFKEDHTPHLEAYAHLTLEDFEVQGKQIQEQIKIKEDANKKMALETLRFLQEKDLEHAYFSRKSFPNFLEKVKLGEFVRLEGKWLAFESGIYKKDTPIAAQEIIDAHIPYFLETVTTIKSNIHLIDFLKAVQKQLNPLSVIHAIAKEIKQIEIEREEIPLAFFNRIIAKEIKEQPAPFIYERLGERYKHYFIDEFQDTSSLQWQNLIPLISNALDGNENASLLLVGDPKQAIYRWRGGKAEQFIDLFQSKTKPFQIAVTTSALAANYRSTETIVSFNNKLFGFAAKFLENEVYRDLYENQSAQHPINQNQGYVEIRFEDMPKAKDLDIHAQYVKDTIIACIERGHAYSDICVLTRKGNQLNFLANYLAEYQIPVISSESLLLSQQPKIRFLIDLLSYAIQPENTDITIKLGQFLFEKESGSDYFSFATTHLRNWAVFLESTYNFSLASFRNLALLDAMSYAIKCFNLSETSDAYLNYFLDEILVFYQNGSGSFSDFLIHWEQQKDRLSLLAPEDSNAIKLLTIHKSKGLEFPIVIYPYANDPVYYSKNNPIWVPMSSNVAWNGPEKVMINYNTKLEQLEPAIAEVYAKERDQLGLDTYNVLYVALTRAEKELYICSKPPSKKSTSQSLSSIFHSFLVAEQLWLDEQPNYHFGQKTVGKQKELSSQQKIPFLANPILYNKQKFITKGGQLWTSKQEEAIQSGNLLHQVMAHIYKEEDIAPALSRALDMGWLSTEELDLLEKQILAIVQHPALQLFFVKNAIAWNEKDIVLNTGEIIRPDKFVIHNNQASVLDYKTGIPHKKHHLQLEQYAQAISEMGYTIHKKILVYSNEELEVKFV